MNSPLRWTRQHARLTLWVGLLALCLQWLSGGISSAHQFQRLTQGLGLLEVCTSPGSPRQSAPDPSDPGAPTPGQLCAYCVAACAALLPPPPLATLAPSSLTIAVISVIPDGIPAAAPDLRHARSRAPPFFA
jgi:hypothetical protein